MNLQRKINNTILLTATIVGSIVALSLYYVKQVEIEGLREDALNELAGILEGQREYLAQELVNERIFAVEMRKELIEKKFKQQSLTADFFGLSGESIGTVADKSAARSALEKMKPSSQSARTHIGHRVYFVERIEYGSEPIGYVVLSIPVEDSLSGSFAKYLYIAFGGSAVCAFLILLIMSTFLRRNVQNPIKQIMDSIPHVINFIHSDESTLKKTDLGSTEFNAVRDNLHEAAKSARSAIIARKKVETDAAIDSAIAQTSQMLAHDLRKPFSMMKLIMGLISTNKDDPKALVKIAENFSEEADQALDRANAMIGDIIEVGSSAKADQKPASLRKLVADSIRENAAAFPSLSKVQFDIEIDIDSALELDKARVQRMLSNVIGNALEATGERGRIWFLAKQKDETMCEITIGNSNSFISPELQDLIFQPFFSQGKRNGTGLGLAIARKVVMAHEGNIWCRSAKDVGTEIIFTLPLSTEKDNYSESLPRTLGEARYKISSQDRTEDSNDSVAKLSDKISKATEYTKLKVLVADDEQTYCDAIASFTKAFGTRVEVTKVNDLNEVKNTPNINEYTAVILDVDFKSKEANGFDVSEHLRSRRYQGKICIHSDHNAFDYYKTAVDRGADIFIPKPMSKEQFFRILLSSIPDTPASS